jgi:hypothetical protein
MIILLAALAHCPTTKQMNRQCLCYNFCSLSTQCLFSVKLGKGEIVIVCHSCSVSLGFTRTPFTKSLKIVSLVSNDSYAAAVADRRGIHSISTNLLETPYLVGVMNSILKSWSKFERCYTAHSMMHLYLSGKVGSSFLCGKNLPIL